MKDLREVTVDIDIHANKNTVWDLIFNRFGEVNDFNPLIIGSRQVAGHAGEVGVERTCDIDEKNQVREKITNVRGQDSFEVDIIEGGLPMMDKMLGIFELKAKGDDLTNVQITCKYSTNPAFMGGVIKSKMAKTFHKMTVGLKYHLETGQLVTKENIKEIMKEFKKLQPGEKFEQLESVAA